LDKNLSKLLTKVLEELFKEVKEGFIIIVSKLQRESQSIQLNIFI